MAKIRILAGDLSVVAGSAAYSEELALRLARRGHAVSVVCFRATPRLRETCEVLEIGRSPRRDTRFLWRFAYYLDESHCGRALRHAALKEVDIAIGLEHLLIRPHQKLFLNTSLIYVPLSLVAPIEIASYNLSRTTRWLSVRLFHKIQKWAMHSADVTMRFNQMSCKMLDAFYGQRAHEYVVNPIGVDLPSETASAGTRKAVRLLSLGRLTAAKNTEFALSALARLRDYPWQFDIVGAGERIEPLRQFISANGLEDKVRCHGWQPESRPWFVNADLVLFTSRLDNCPLVVLESMSYGVPVLGIRPDGKDYVSGIGELIEHGRTGLLASGEADFSRQLEAVCQQPEQLASLGRAARSQIAEQHTWERHLDRYEEVFDRLTTKDRSRPLQMIQQIETR